MSLRWFKVLLITQKCTLDEEIQISQLVFSHDISCPTSYFEEIQTDQWTPSPVTVYEDKPIVNIWHNPEALKNSSLLFPTECIHVPIKYIHGPLWKAWGNPWQRLWIITLGVYTHAAFRSQDVPPTAPVVKVSSHSMLDPHTIHVHWSLTLYDLYLNLCLTRLTALNFSSLLWFSRFSNPEQFAPRMCHTLDLSDYFLMTQLHLSNFKQMLARRIQWGQSHELCTQSRTRMLPCLSDTVERILKSHFRKEEFRRDCF